MQLLHLRGRKVCTRVLAKGSTWRGKTMIVRWMPGPPKHERASEVERIFLGTFASAKLDKSAVVRNRMRRRCREAFRTTLKEIDKLPTAQLLLTPRSSSLTCAFTEIVSDVHSFLSTLRA